MAFQTKVLPVVPDAIAPDGSQVRELLRLPAGSMAHFQLAPGHVSSPVANRSVDELWYCLSGCGEMWRKLGNQEQVVILEPGVNISLPAGTHFQFRSLGSVPLAILGLTLPPWPGDEESRPVPGNPEWNSGIQA